MSTQDNFRDGIWDWDDWHEAADGEQSADEDLLHSLGITPSPEALLFLKALRRHDDGAYRPKKKSGGYYNNGGSD